MKLFADFHIHSHYSRATSGQMNIEELSVFGRRKGLGIIGTGDYSHPLWNKELKEKLGKGEEGIYNYNGMNFILSNEVSLIYSQDKKVRKIHLLLLSPDFETVDQINDWLGRKGKLDYDGRPIFGMTCPEFCENIMEISSENFIIPAHAWTPWFGIFGSMTGFDSVEECFGDQVRHIHAIETGLSSDPPMNWRLSSLDKFALVSNSDSHSPWPSRMGRECNAFDLREITYTNIIKAIREKDPSTFLYTVEVDPSYGKYHLDGHRTCNISLFPKDAIKRKNFCPVCGRPLTIGVLHRVEELADRPEGFVPRGAIPFKSVLPLAEIISAFYGAGTMSRKVAEKEAEFIDRFGNELSVLLEVPRDELEKVDCKLAEWIIRNREGKITIIPGYDGVYGKIALGNETEGHETNAKGSFQKCLSDFN